MNSQSMPKHTLEMAKALVEVRDGEVKVLSDPLIRRCPLRAALYGCEEESRQSVEQVLRGHIRELGMYSPNRVLEIYQKPVSFGASEIVMDAMAEDLVDAAVVACEGAGTVVVTKPEVLQAVGAHMTGLIRTDPISEIIKGLSVRGCLIIDGHGTIDQVEGYVRARQAGYKKIAVTIAGHRAAEACKIREMEKDSGVASTILAVHTTGVSDQEAEILAKHCDLVWGCASKSVRERIGSRSKLQIGIAIPVFALTHAGKRLLLNRALHFEESLVLYRASLPYLPPEKQPSPLI